MCEKESQRESKCKDIRGEKQWKKHEEKEVKKQEIRIKIRKIKINTISSFENDTRKPASSKAFKYGSS